MGTCQVDDVSRPLVTESFSSLSPPFFFFFYVLNSSSTCWGINIFSLGAHAKKVISTEVGISGLPELFSVLAAVSLHFSRLGFRFFQRVEGGPNSFHFHLNNNNYCRLDDLLRVSCSSRWGMQGCTKRNFRLLSKNYDSRFVHSKGLQFPGITVRKKNKCFGVYN